MVVFRNENTDNLCFFNCVMQVLINIHDENKPLKCQFDRILRKLKVCDVDKLVNPKTILKFFESPKSPKTNKWSKRFEIGQPHDFHEALMFILDTVHNDTFEGKIIDTIVTTSKPIEKATQITPFSTIELYPQHDDLYKCINDFCDVEYISGWKDTHENEREIVKFQTIVEFPRHFMFLVKQGYNKKAKLNYPSVLKTKNIDSCSYNIHYKLRCIVIHKMYHYFCYMFEDKWILYNDDTRDEVSKDVDWRPRFAPYCLIYSRSPLRG